MRSAWLVSAAAIPMLLAAEARADGCDPQKGISTCIEADNLWPHAGNSRFFSIGGTTTTPARGLSFGLVGTYLKQPIGLTVASAEPGGSTVFAVDDRFDASLLFALGVTDRLELTLVAPVTLYQSGAGLSGIIGGGPTLPRSAVRDFRFGFALALLARPRTGEERGPAVTARFELGMPVGTQVAFASAPGAVFAPSVVFDWRIGRVLVAAEAFARVRPEAPLANATIGTQIGGSAGVMVDVLPERWLTVGGEMFAAPTISKQLLDPRDTSGASAKPLAPGEWIASVSNARLLGGDVVVSLGGGASLPFVPHAVTSPKYRLDFSIRYAPTGRDTDGDGVLDRDDKCPTEKEDRDGFQDADGCPDPDNDGDGIPDAQDKCRDAPEDFDGHEDADGCPDLDDDHDGVPDEQDKCRNEPEDRDGFQDADGCPDPDNDGDGIPDVRDKCPNDPEDFDGFQDADGCPDPDNDRDGVLDAQDKCPNDPEDRDGFQDADGCSDPDNDEDGVLDAQDKCPNEAETINGVADEDGCPEPNARSLVRWEGDRVIVDAPARFPAGKAALPPDLLKQARMMAQLARGRAPLGSVVIETYPDRAGDTSLRGAELAASRAEAVKKVFVDAGVPADIISAVPGDPVAKRAPPRAGLRRHGAKEGPRSPRREGQARRERPEMNVRESRRTRHLVIRLDRGDELPAALVRALDEAEARSAFISGVGALEAAEVAI
ncbi:MAG: thrombospondin type 3 repeat-containing protein [Minicystis sp.]